MSKVVHSKEDAIDLLENFSIIEKAEYFRRLDEYVGLLYEWRDINEASLESRAVSSTRKRKESTVCWRDHRHIGNWCFSALLWNVRV